MRNYRSLDIEEKLQIYNEVLELWKKDLNYKQIRKIIEKRYNVELSKPTVVRWIRGKQHPLGRYNKLIEGAKLAYAISAWIGDGTLAHTHRKSRPEYNITLGVKDYDFAEEWGQCVAKALGRKEPYKPRWDKCSRGWVTTACSKLLYNLLKDAKDDPCILMPYLEKYPGDACRGFFDAEGGVSADSYQIRAYNTDLRIIRLFKMLLEKIGIQCNIYEIPYKDNVLVSPRNGKIYHINKQSCFRLVIHRKENILKFAEWVSFTIARKRAGLARILQRYNRIKIPSNCIEKCARALIAANLVRLGLMRTQKEAAKLLLISEKTISDYLRDKRRSSKLLRLPEIERLSREHFYSRGDEIIARVREILQAMIEMYGG